MRESADLKDIIHRAKHSDKQAVTDLYEQTKNSAYYVAKRYLPESDIQDALQEVYINVFKSLATFDESKDFKAWLHTITRNTCLNALKKEQRSSSFSAVTDDKDLAELPDSDNILPNELLEHEEKRQAVLNIIDKLPINQKLAVTLFYYDGLTVNEIADTMELATGTVKSHLSRARATIKSEVLMEEEKGNKLYAVVPVPFLTKLFQMEESSCTMPIELSAKVLQGALQGAGIIGTTSTIGGVIMGLSITAKTTIAVASAIAVVTVGTVVYQNTNKKPPETEPVQAVISSSSTSSEGESSLINTSEGSNVASNTDTVAPIEKDLPDGIVEVIDESGITKAEIDPSLAAPETETPAEVKTEQPTIVTPDTIEMPATPTTEKPSKDGIYEKPNLGDTAGTKPKPYSELGISGTDDKFNTREGYGHSGEAEDLGFS